MWIQTYTGKKFHLFDPKLDEIDIVDIAHGLSNICRYTGQCNAFYSVAQHSVLISQLVSEKNALQGLMHDSAEAYISDLSSPLKHGLWEYRVLENRLLKFIFGKFNIAYPVSEEVNYQDRALCVLEKEKLFNQPLDWGWENKYTKPIIELITWNREWAKAEFLNRFMMLSEAK